MEIRRVIYTTNAIESLISPAETLRERSLRKVIKTKAVFPSKGTVLRQMYLAMNNISKKWGQPIKNWKAALSHFAILFPECFTP